MQILSCLSHSCGILFVTMTELRHEIGGSRALFCYLGISKLLVMTRVSLWRAQFLPQNCRSLISSYLVTNQSYFTSKSSIILFETGLLFFSCLCISSIIQPVGFSVCSFNREHRPAGATQKQRWRKCNYWHISALGEHSAGWVMKTGFQTQELHQG